MKTWIISQIVVSLFLVAGCSKGTNEGAIALGKQLQGKTFQAQGLDQVSVSITSACGSGSTEPGYSLPDDPPPQAGDDSAPPTTDDPIASSALIRASHDSVPEIVFGSDSLSVEGETYEWKAVDGDTIEIAVNGTEVQIDVRVNDSTLIVSLSPDFDCPSEPETQAGVSYPDPQDSAPTNPDESGPPTTLPSEEGPSIPPDETGPDVPREPVLPEEGGYTFPYCSDTSGPFCRQRDNAPSTTVSACKITGCSGHVCSDKDAVTTCEWKPEYGCYKSAECTRQVNGKCGWTMTATLSQCL
ncbi:MAG: hypothetical protein Q7S00_07005, partial [bacterium]|nr:hypothetical protein [bacterium]